MTNREWLNSLNNEEFVKVLHQCNDCHFCMFDKWLDEKRTEPMPQIKEGDYILYEYNNVVYRAFCVYGTIVYLIDRGVCTNFDGEIKESTIVIKRYDNIKGTLEDIWRADNE